MGREEARVPRIQSPAPPDSARYRRSRRGDGQEPDRHGQPEQPADLLRPAHLDTNRPMIRSNEIGTIHGWAALVATDTFDRRDHRRIARRDYAVTEEHRRPDDDDHDEPGRPRRPFSRRASRSARRGGDPALTVVVDAHDEADVLDANHEIGAQMISERMPSTFSGLTPTPALVKQVFSVYRGLVPMSP